MNPIFKVIKNVKNVQNDNSSEKSISGDLNNISKSYNNLLGNKRLLEDKIKIINEQHENLASLLATEIKNNELLNDAMEKNNLIAKAKIDFLNEQLTEKNDIINVKNNDILLLDDKLAAVFRVKSKIHSEWVEFYRENTRLKEENEGLSKYIGGLKEENAILKDLYNDADKRVDDRDITIENLKKQLAKEREINEYVREDFVKDLENVEKSINNIKNKI